MSPNFLDYVQTFLLLAIFVAVVMIPVLQEVNDPEIRDQNPIGAFFVLIAICLVATVVVGALLFALFLGGVIGFGMLMDQMHG